MDVEAEAIRSGISKLEGQLAEKRSEAAVLTTRRQGNEANIRRLQNELSDQENRSGDLESQIAARALRLREIDQETETQKATRKIIARAERTIRTAAVPSEIDLRGMMTDEAVMAVERFLDTAMMGKLETVTIIHGKGTGAVRNAVRSYLKRSRYVKAFRPGRYGEGEDGVTVVTLK